MKNQFHNLSLLVVGYETQCSISHLSKMITSPHSQNSRMTDLLSTDIILDHLLRTIRKISRQREDSHWMSEPGNSCGKDIQTSGISQFEIFRDCAGKIQNDVRDRAIS